MFLICNREHCLVFECIESNHFNFRDEETHMNSSFEMNNVPETEMENFISVLFILHPPYRNYTGKAVM